MSKTPMHVQLIVDPSVPHEVKKWISEFTTALLSSRHIPSEVLILLIGLKVDIPGSCDCQDPIDHEAAFRWLHVNHRRYNRAMWELIIGSRYFERVRVALVQDVVGPENIIDGQAFGALVPKDYGRKLLDNFLRRDPYPEWVGVEE